MDDAPEFFRWTSDVNRAGQFPRAHLLSLRPRILELAQGCPFCGVEMPIRYGGDISLRVEDVYPRAKEWPDCLETMPFPPASLVISERIVRDLRRAGFGSFNEERATVMKNECALLRSAAPQYFYMHVAGRIDVEVQRSYGFEGIDYLGAAWPPKSWYPDLPQAGKAKAEWVEELRSTDRERGYLATLALLEIGAPAVPELTTLFTTGNSLERYRAANVLGGLSHQGVAIPSGLKEQVEKELAQG